MKIRVLLNRFGLLAPMLIASAVAAAQVPVNDQGEVIGQYQAQGGDVADIPLLAASELEDLVGPIALYPDDLLAVVLPASTYPLQVVEAKRFLERRETDSSLEPDPEWDDSIIALLNYPEVLDLLNDDLDWTWRLGEAVVAQQDDVVAAVESFRERAYTAGNLQSDEHQTISRDDGVIEISPIEEDVIYVPYYEPEEVVVYQPRRVYYYYPTPAAVYYYPYPAHYAFHRGYFWGVTTAFTIGWVTDRLHVYHHSYYGHPYYGHYYPSYWWYRRPTLSVYNRIYLDGHYYGGSRHYHHGDFWRPRHHRQLRHSDRQIVVNRHYPSSGDVRHRDYRNDSRRDHRRDYRSDSRSDYRRDQQRDYRSDLRRDQRRDQRSDVRRGQRGDARLDGRGHTSASVDKQHSRQTEPVRAERRAGGNTVVRREQTRQHRDVAPERRLSRPQSRPPQRQASRQESRPPQRQASRQESRPPQRQASRQESRERSQSSGNNRERQQASNSGGSSRSTRSSRSRESRRRN